MKRSEMIEKIAKRLTDINDGILSPRMAYIAAENTVRLAEEAGMRPPAVVTQDNKHESIYDNYGKSIKFEWEQE